MRSEGCMDCPFYEAGGGCKVYEERPFMCRLYGTVENLRCPHGYGPAKLMPAQRGNELVGQYMEIVRKYPAMLPAYTPKVRIDYSEDGFNNYARVVGQIGSME